MILAAFPDNQLGDLQQAARALVRHSILVPGGGRERDLALVRRFSAELDTAFDELCGYRLLLRGRGARLVRPHDQLDPTPTLESQSGRAFDRDRLALLFLSLSELDRFPHQVALSELASTLRRAVLDLGAGAFDPDQHAHRRAFCDVLDALIRLGVLVLTDGALSLWEQDPELGEALFDVDHDAALLLFRPTRVLEQLGSASELLAVDRAVGRDPRRTEIRRRVARTLLCQPVVLFADLDEPAASYLALEWRSLSADLERLLGCAVERRKEGAAVIDDVPGGLGERFPQGGSAGHAALLLAERIVRALDDAEPATAPSPQARCRAMIAALDEALDLPGATPEDAAPEPAGPLVTRTWLEATAADLIAEFGNHLKADLRVSPSALLEEALPLLARFELVRSVPGGVVPTPALARYRRPEFKRAEGPQVGLFTALQADQETP